MLIPHIPEENGSIRSPTSEQCLVDWVPGNGSDFLLVTLESEQLLHHPDIVDLDQAVLGSCEQPIPILVPLDAVHSSFVDVKG